MGIIAVRVTSADLAVYTVDQNLGVIADCLLSCYQLSLFLDLSDMGAQTRMDFFSRAIYSNTSSSIRCSLKQEKNEYR